MGLRWQGEEERQRGVLLAVLGPGVSARLLGVGRPEGKGGVSWAAGMIRAAVWVGPERRGKAGPVWEKGSGQLGCVAKLGWIGFGSWFSFLFSIQILKPTNKQRFEFKYKFEFKPHSNN